MPPKKKIRYDDSYLKFGFTAIKCDGEEKPQCALCCTVLASTSLKPSKLKRHLETHHPDSSNKDLNFFKRKTETLIKSRLDQSGMFWKDTKSGLRASNEVSRKIAVSKKTHNIGEDLKYCLAAETSYRMCWEVLSFRS